MKALTTFLLSGLLFVNVGIYADPANPETGALALTNAVALGVAIVTLNAKAGK